MLIVTGSPVTARTYRRLVPSPQSVPLCRLSVIVWTIKLALPAATLLGLLSVLVSL